jgi:hypothetical protein
MEAGVVNPVDKARQDLDILQAKRRVKDIRLWPRVPMGSQPEYLRLVSYGQALLAVRVPEPLGKMSELAIRKLREQLLISINGIIRDVEPFNDNIPLLMADSTPSPEPQATSGHEHIMNEPPAPPQDIEGMRALLANLQAGLDNLQPAAAEPERTDIGWAVRQLRDGKKVAPAYWNGKKWLVMQFPDENSKMTMPYIYVEYPPNHRIPWAISNLELFAEDWMIIE